MMAMLSQARGDKTGSARASLSWRDLRATPDHGFLSQAAFCVTYQDRQPSASARQS